MHALRVTTHQDAAGQRIRRRRLALDLTIRQAASRAQVSDTTWGALEAGRPVSDRTVRRATQALEWPPDAIDRLLAGEDPDDWDDPTSADVGGFAALGLDLTSDEAKQAQAFIEGLRAGRGEQP